MDERHESEGSSGQELVDWLIEQIEKTTYMERLQFIGETIAEDRKAKREYLTDERLVKLRDAWHRKSKQLE